MYSPEDQAEARTTAELHARIAVIAAQPTRTQPGQCWLRAELIEVWRAPPGLAAGSVIEVWVDSCWRGQRSPPGEDVRLCIEDLVAGRQIELHARALPSDPAGQACFAVTLGLAELR